MRFAVSITQLARCQLKVDALQRVLAFYTLERRTY